MSTVDSKTIERIRKCLRLFDSNIEGEQLAAMRALKRSLEAANLKMSAVADMVGNAASSALKWTEEDAQLIFNAAKQEGIDEGYKLGYAAGLEAGKQTNKQSTRFNDVQEERSDSIFEAAFSMGGVLKPLYVPPGNYRVKLDRVNQKTSKAGNEMFEWHFVGVEGDAEGYRFKYYTILDHEWKIHDVIEALGRSVRESEIEINDLIGNECMAIVQDENYKGKIYPKIVDLYED